MLGQSVNSRRARWGIGLSIALNLFFAAFIGAQAWRLHHLGEVISLPRGGGLASADVQSIIEKLAKNLPPADGRLIRGAFAAKMPQLVALQAELLRTSELVHADIAQKPFSADKLQTDMNAAAVARQQIPPVIQDVLLDVLPQMSDEGRLVLSQYWLLPQR